MLENHYSSQQESLTASLTVVHHSLGQLREGAANTAGRFKELQVGSDIVQPLAQSLHRELFLSTFN